MDRVERRLRVTNGLGLHARVATMIVRSLEDFSCEVTLVKDDVEVNAKSVLGLLLLAATAGSEITARAHGPDCREAVEKIARLIEHEGHQTG